MENHTLKVLEFDKIIAKLMNQTACALGKEAAGLTYPTTDLAVAKRKQQETSEAKAILECEGSIPLGGIEDIRHSIERAGLDATLQPSDLLAVLNTLQSCRRLGQYLVKLRTKYPILGELGSEIESFNALEAEISGAISQNAEVMDSASIPLARVRSELHTVQARLTERMNSYLQSSSYKTIIQEPVITIRSDRYCIPIKSDHRGQFPGIVHDASASGATLFIEPASVVEMGNRRKQLAVREREEVEKVLMKLTSIVGENAERITASLNVVGLIDCISARAKLSILLDASEPILNNRGQIDIIDGRHPLLEGDVVPINLTLGKKFSALLITGPNTGGKTVSLKTVGLFSLMAACGLHVSAASGTELAVYEDVFADIGDEQSIEQSLSTFSSHLNNIVRITQHSTRNSLVLIDEIGAGTDPGEGSALAKAILDFLLGKGAKIIATTHYGELKEFAYMREGIENASVEFDLETLRPTYHLRIGIPGSSNALAIAARLGLNQQIIDNAKTNLSAHNEASEELIRRIEESHRVAAEERRAAEKRAFDAEELRRRYEDQVRRLENAKDQVESKTRERAQIVLDSYTKRLEETLQALSMQKKDSRRAQDLKKKAEKIIDKMEADTVEKTVPKEAPEEDLPIETQLKRGTKVRIAGVNQDGEVVEPPQDGKVVVFVGTMRITVPVSSLRKAKGDSGRKTDEQSFRSQISLEKAKSFSPEIHLRGMRVEPALIELDKYLDDALAAGAGKVRIVHGKGTGQMRQAVWEYLRTHPGVKSYKLGEEDEGGYGVTIAVMKG